MRWFQGSGFLVGLLLCGVVSAPSAQTLDAGKRKTLERVLAAADDAKWAWARKLVRDLDEPVLLDYLRWRELKAEDAGKFADFKAFIEAHEDWPDLYRLQVNLEAVLDEEVPHSERLAFFSRRAPITRQGRTRYAQSLLATGAEAKAAAIARASWIEDDFSTGEERFFLGLFAPLLRAEDHEARLDRLLWDEKTQSARSMLDRVDEGHQRLALARITLQTNAPGVDRSIARVPAALRNDPGLTMDRLEWRKRKGRDAAVRELLMDPPRDLRRPAKWWYHRAYQTRELVEQRRFDAAYALVSRHGQNDGLDGAEANFLQGWLALRFVDRPAEALAAFERLYASVASPISLARGAYWAGRAAQTLGQHDRARFWFQRAARHGTAFYGQLALDALGERLRLPKAEAAPPLNNLNESPANPAFVRIASLLCSVAAENEAHPFLEQLLLEGHHPAAVMGIAQDCANAKLMVELAKDGVRAGVLHPVWSYPLPFLDDFAQFAGDRSRQALVTAVARQESHFDHTAESRARARGLMQLMPGTAQAMAKALAVSYTSSRLVDDPGYNLALGARYLDDLDARFDGSLALMAAAYNAGPKRVGQWIDTHGDPRESDLHALVDWIELIPYRETRNYVQRIIEGYRVYEELLNPNRDYAPLEGGNGDRKASLIPLPKPKPRATLLVPAAKPVGSLMG